MSKANDRQVGGTHYQTGTVQHWDVAAELYGEAHFKCTATKYSIRWRNKNGLQDLEKAKHYLVKLIELMEEGFTVLMPSTKQFIKMTCDRMRQGVNDEDWALMCRIFAAESVEDLKDCIADIDNMMLNASVSGSERSS